MPRKITEKEEALLIGFVYSTVERLRIKLSQLRKGCEKVNPAIAPIFSKMEKNLGKYIQLENLNDDMQTYNLYLAQAEFSLANKEIEILGKKLNLTYARPINDNEMIAEIVDRPFKAMRFRKEDIKTEVKEIEIDVAMQ